MTYTHKLARRLSLVRIAPVLALAAGAACAGGDGQDSLGPADAALSRVVVTPKTATIAVNQKIQLAAYGRSAGGDSVPVEVQWSASGGVIDPDGAFLSSLPGMYRVIGWNRKPGVKADTTTIEVVADSGKAQLDSPPDPGQPTTPDPSAAGSSYPDQPSGFVKISERGFTARGEDGWSTTRVERLSLIADPTAPLSDKSVGRVLYPRGFQGGYEPVVIARTLSPKPRDLYLSFWVKFSPNFVGHPTSGVNKVFHLWINKWNRVYLSAQGRGNGTLVPQIRLQRVAQGDGYANLKPNVSDVTLQRGTWYHWEVVVRANHPGRSDGSAQWWINGQEAGSYTGLAIIGNGGSDRWEQVQLAPTWGGVGERVPADQSMYIDHIYISGQ